MSDYTPTTKEVRESFYIHAFNRDMEHLRAEAFDRWLTARDAEIRTAALEEATVIAKSFGMVSKRNLEPYWEGWGDATDRVSQAIDAAKNGEPTA